MFVNVYSSISCKMTGQEGVLVWGPPQMTFEIDSE